MQAGKRKVTLVWLRFVLNDQTGGWDLDALHKPRHSGCYETIKKAEFNIFKLHSHVWFKIQKVMSYLLSTGHLTDRQLSSDLTNTSFPDQTAHCWQT